MFKKKLVLVLGFLCTLNVFAFEERAVECSEDDHTVKQITRYLAKKDMKALIINSVNDLNIEIIKDSIEFDINYVYENELDIKASFLTKQGSSIMVYTSFTADDEGNNYMTGLVPFYNIYETIERNPEGIPISRTCEIYTTHANSYKFINQSYDNYLIVYDVAPVFTSTFSLQVPL